MSVDQAVETVSSLVSTVAKKRKLDPTARGLDAIIEALRTSQQQSPGSSGGGGGGPGGGKRFSAKPAVATARAMLVHTLDVSANSACGDSLAADHPSSGPGALAPDGGLPGRAQRRDARERAQRDARRASIMTS